MNVFVLDKDPRIAAEMECNKHVVKMPTETAQLLCSAYWATEQKIEPPYRLSHAKHPWAIWARTTMTNWNWLLEHGLYLYIEYAYRYGKRHKGGEVILWAESHPPALPEGPLTPMPLCMPEDCKEQSEPQEPLALSGGPPAQTDLQLQDVVQSYRNYYMWYKLPILQYRKRPYPLWMQEYPEWKLIARNLSSSQNGYGLDNEQ